MHAAIEHPVEMLRTLYKSFKSHINTVLGKELYWFYGSSLPNGDYSITQLESAVITFLFNILYANPSDICKFLLLKSFIEK